MKCISIGYVDKVIDYCKLWKLDPGKSRCFISRDVTFNETQIGMMCKSMEVSKEKT